MMHLHMIGLAVAIAVFIRYASQLVSPTKHWSLRWARALTAFVVPPLFLLATAVSILAMGTDGPAVWDSWTSYGLSLGFVLCLLGLWTYLGGLAIKTRWQMRLCPQQPIETAFGAVPGRIMSVREIFSAQVGLWSSDLVVSEGLISCLDEEHLSAVIAHELGHVHYRDTFWFFWLGGLRRVSGWLPYSEQLWQELLLLREVRADHWASRRVDSLVLAESLVSVVTAPLMTAESICPGFSCAAPRSRLAQRIDALLSDDLSGLSQVSLGALAAIALSLTPLLVIPFHH
ncbi:MAG: M56 family metallopeptidase [Cyanobacteria bacterium J06643_4]